MEGHHITGDPPPRPAESFDEVFDVHFAEIHRYAAKRLGPDAAADVAAQTFLEAFRQRRRYDPERANVRTWLYGIATKVVGRHQRAETRALRARARLGPGRAEEHTEQVDARVSAEGLRSELAGAICRSTGGAPSPAWARRPTKDSFPPAR
jgi:DNA-directed RNA polymerase specialized sigma24 family protein